MKIKKQPKPQKDNLARKMALNGIERIDDEKFRWICPECGRVDIIDDFVVNYIMHTSNLVVCDICKRMMCD